MRQDYAILSQPVLHRSLVNLAAHLHWLRLRPLEATTMIHLRSFSVNSPPGFPLRISRVTPLSRRLFSSGKSGNLKNIPDISTGSGALPLRRASSSSPWVHNGANVMEPKTRTCERSSFLLFHSSYGVIFELLIDGVLFKLYTAVLAASAHSFPGRFLIYCIDFADSIIVRISRSAWPFCSGTYIRRSTGNM